MNYNNIGFAKINKKNAIAGSYDSVRYTFHTLHPVDDTGCIKIAFRFAGDFGIPQFKDPKAENYCSISTTADCRIEPRWDVKGNTRPWGRTLYLKVMGGYLDRGDTATVVFGDRTGGPPGWQIQTLPFPDTSGAEIHLWAGTGIYTLPVKTAEYPAAAETCCAVTEQSSSTHSRPQSCSGIYLSGK